MSFKFEPTNIESSTQLAAPKHLEKQEAAPCVRGKLILRASIVVTVFLEGDVQRRRKLLISCNKAFKTGSCCRRSEIDGDQGLCSPTSD